MVVLYFAVVSMKIGLTEEIPTNLTQFQMNAVTTCILGAVL